MHPGNLNPDIYIYYVYYIILYIYMYTHTHTIYIYLSLFHGAHRLNFTAVIRWNSDCIVGHGSSLFVKTQEMPKGQFMNHVGMALVAVGHGIGTFQQLYRFWNHLKPLNTFLCLGSFRWRPGGHHHQKETHRHHRGRCWGLCLDEPCTWCCWGLGWTAGMS